jgi:hypothetical protein
MMTTIANIILVSSVIFCLYLILGFDLARSTAIPPKWRIWLNPIRNSKTDPEWDRKLNQLLNENAPIEIMDQYQAMIGNQQIWIENFPYATFSGPGRWVSSIPSRKTTVRLTERLMQHGWTPK